MSITKITDPSAVPAAVADYEAQNIHLDRLLGDAVAPYPVSGSNVVKGALFNIGGDMFYCGADTAISGTPSDYVKLVVSGSNAVPSFVASLSGVTWNSAYNGYYSGSDLYLFDEVKAVLAGAISGYKTAMGAMFETVRTQGISMKGATDVDRNIAFASDADLLWDESEDEFYFNKDIRLNGGLKTNNSYILMRTVSGVTNASGIFSINHGVNPAKIVGVACTSYIVVADANKEVDSVQADNSSILGTIKTAVASVEIRAVVFYTP